MIHARVAVEKSIKSAAVSKKQEISLIGFLTKNLIRLFLYTLMIF